METKHNELLDQVINESKNEIPADGSIEDKVNAGCIPIHSCTGALYFIDPKDPGNQELFGDKIMDNIRKFSEMEMSLINVMHNLLIINEFPEEEKQPYLDNLITQFTQSLNGYGIKANYDELNKELTDYTKAMFMAFDLMSFAKTINHFLVSMVESTMLLGNMMQQPKKESPYTTDLDVDIPTNEENALKCFKVFGHIQSDNTVSVIQVTEEPMGDHDFLVVTDEEDDELENVVSLYTLGASEEQAATDAQIVFDGYVRDLIETEAEKAIRIADEMSAPSGLLE